MKSEPRKPRSPEQYDEEYRALQASLEDYLRQQVKLLAQAGRAMDTGAVREGWWRRYRADLYFVVTLALIGFLGWRTLWPPSGGQDNPAVTEPAPESPPVSTPPPPAPPPPTLTPPPPTAASEPPEGFEDPGTWWSGFVSANRGTVADWLTAVSEARGLAATEVSELQKGNFKRWAAKVRSGTETAEERNLCQRGLFEYVYGLWTKSEAKTGGSWGKVDLVLSADEYPNEKLKTLLSELGVDHWFDRVDQKDRRAQVAAVLGWLEGHSP